ncbi:MAG: gamma-glutamyl-gamma-aminobutyrate hydrolase family protein [Bacilli bacterium]|nr:gamma-glutamyl-gamma-aminobutyrate hydrolase family protein [Bacilli bacterium]
MKKRVGVILRTEKINDVLKHYVRNSMLEKLTKYDIEIICIPIINNLENIYSIIDTCDGIIFPGGDDVVAKDLEILNYVYKNNTPTLGICLGMQEMAIFKNGMMIDLNDDKHNMKDNETHEVIIDISSKLYEIIGKEKITVNSRHHSIISKTDLNISAHSTDNIIEAVEDPSKDFFVGVQWHPEDLEVEETYLLLNYFINCL